jgi:hypothetical protein
MTRLLSASLLALSLLGASTLTGCSSPCDALSDLCEKCKDANTKATCSQTAATYKAVPVSGNSACQAVLDAKTFSSCE